MKIKFYSTGDKDTFARMYDSSMSELTYNDDGGEKQNFLINRDVVSGNTYYLSCKYYSSTATGSFTVKLEKYSETAKSISSCKIELSQYEYTYSGSAKTPTVTVKDGSKALVKGTDYNVSYENNTNVGTAKAIVTGIGSYTGTTWALFTIKAGKTSFVWQRDNWNFNNSSTFFTKSTHRKMINSTYLNKLNSELTPRDREIAIDGYYNSKGEWVNGWIDQDWNGSCYGMSALVALAKLGNVVPYSSYKSGATSLFQLPSPDENMTLSSLVEYYYLLQVTDAVSSIKWNCTNDTDKNNINKIIDLLKTNSVVVVDFRGGGKGHSVVAYDVEYREKQWHGITYQACIKICDPNSSIKERNGKGSLGDDDSYYIWFNTNTYNWEIPHYYDAGYSFCSSRNGYFVFVCADVSVLNSCGYHQSTSVSNSADYVSRINAYSIADSRSVSKVTQSDDGYTTNHAAPGEIVESYFYLSDGDSQGVLGYDLLDSESAYRVANNDPENLELTIKYDNSYLTACSDAGRSVIFDKDGVIKLESDPAPYSMSMTFDNDYPTDWDTLALCGESASDVTLKTADGGYILTADNLSNVKLSAHNLKVKTERSFSTDHNSVFIYEIDDKTIGLRVDADGNGTYETELGLETGDANGDGRIDVNDVTAIQRELAKLEELTPDQKRRADVNRDGVVDVRDATAIQKFLANILNSF